MTEYIKYMPLVKTKDGVIYKGRLFENKSEALKHLMETVPPEFRQKENLRYRIDEIRSFHEGWSKKRPICEFMGNKSDLKLIDTDKRNYGYWNLYEYTEKSKRWYFVELFLA